MTVSFHHSWVRQNMEKMTKRGNVFQKHPSDFRGRVFAQRYVCIAAAQRQKSLHSLVVQLFILSFSILKYPIKVGMSSSRTVPRSLTLTLCWMGCWIPKLIRDAGDNHTPLPAGTTAMDFFSRGASPNTNFGIVPRI